MAGLPRAAPVRRVLLSVQTMPVPMLALVPVLISSLLLLLLLLCFHPLACQSPLLQP